MDFFMNEKNFNCWKTKLNHVPRQPNFGSDRLTAEKKNCASLLYEYMQYPYSNQQFGILAAL